ncbi:hypothetical protein AVEN_200391-1, partial [Araneus ventricosus]
MRFDIRQDDKTFLWPGPPPPDPNSGFTTALASRRKTQYARNAYAAIRFEDKDTMDSR